MAFVFEFFFAGQERKIVRIYNENQVEAELYQEDIFGPWSVS